MSKWGKLWLSAGAILMLSMPMTTNAQAESTDQQVYEVMEKSEEGTTENGDEQKNQEAGGIVDTPPITDIPPVTNVLPPVEGEEIPEGDAEVPPVEGEETPDVEAEVPPVEGEETPDVDAEVPPVEGEEIPDVDVEVPLVEGEEIPDVDTEVPPVEGEETPDVDVEVPPVEGEEIPDVDVEVPPVEGEETPDVDAEVPSVEGEEIPDVDTEVPPVEGEETPDVDTEMPPVEGEEIPDGSAEVPPVEGEETPAEDEENTEKLNADDLAEDEKKETDEKITGGSWSEENGSWYYKVDGEAIKDQVVEIDGKYYGFDWDGRMWANTTFYSPDVDGNYYYYRAKENGELYRNEWYEEEYGARKYYGENGAAYQSWQEVDGQSYYFYEDGTLCRDIVENIEGDNYFFDENGAYTKLNNNNWTWAAGSYYYVQNGEVLRECVEYINGAYYGFEYSGKMYADTVFNIWDYEAGKGYSYRAKADGSLYVNEWYTEEYNGYKDIYYYGEAGIAHEGLYTIDDKIYYFYPGGRVCRNESINVNGENYIFNDDGHGVKLNNNAWTWADGSYYYVQNGEVLRDCVEYINGAYYGFEYNGKMYADTVFGMWNEETQETDTYRAKVDGALCVNEWYHEWHDEYGYGVWYYFGEDGAAYKGVHTIDGILYGFSEWGEMYKDTSVAIDGKQYMFDANGYGTELNNNVWTYVNGDWYYVKDNELLRDCVAYINGAYYGFEYSGKMYTNTEFSVWNSEEGVSYFYRAKENGALYASEWYQYDGHEWYYYGADGAALTGLQEIGGTMYCFTDWGSMYSDTTVTVNGESYYFSKNGYGTKLNNNAWTDIEGIWYYVKDNVILNNCVEYINGAYYGFDWKGKMYDNVRFSIYDESAGRSASYFARSGGALYANEWYKNEYGAWFYYGDKGRAAEGYQNVGGVNYFFNSGQMRISAIEFDENDRGYLIDSNGVATILGDGWTQNPYTQEWIWVQNGKAVQNGLVEIYGKKYLFEYYRMKENVVYQDSDSGSYYILQKGGAILTTPGWSMFNGDWYYVGAEGKLHTGLLQQGNLTYYLDPFMVHNTQIVVVEDGTSYFADRSGHLYAITSDGFYRTNQHATYYVEQGNVVKDTWKWINGNWYYFDSIGIRIENKDQLVDGNRYFFNSDGKMYANTWIYNNNASGYSYATASGALVIGEQYIDGNWYFFDDAGRMMTGAVVYNGNKYLYGTDGIYVGRLNNQGWNLLNGAYYYLSNNEIIRGMGLQIGNEFYAFDHEGRMYRNIKYYVYDGSGNSEYYFGGSGAAAKGWIKLGNIYYYGNPENGKLVKSKKMDIGGATYYFDEVGAMAVGERYIDGKWYHFNNGGALTGISDFANGWSLCNGEYYYYQNGNAYTGWVGNYYVRNGLMMRDTLVSYNNALYALGYDGQYLRNTWSERYGSTGSPVYAKADGRVARDEWVVIDGVWYYFDDIFKMTGYAKIDNVGYLFDKDGKYLGEIQSTSDGWISANGEWYYQNAGELITNQILNIDGTWYGFDYDGKMVKSQLYYTKANEAWYFDANGKRANYTGWKVIDGKWYYFDSDSNAKQGLIRVDNKWYYIDGRNGMITGFRWLENQLYHFGADGALVDKVSQASGWYWGDNTWHYFENGIPVQSGIRNIYGVNYYFSNGKLADEGVYYEGIQGFYVNKDGVIVTAEGWYNTKEGWIYVKSDGSVADRIHRIDGRDYYFTSYGIWAGY